MSDYQATEEGWLDYEDDVEQPTADAEQHAAEDGEIAAADEHAAATPQRGQLSAQMQARLGYGAAAHSQQTAEAKAAAAAAPRAPSVVMQLLKGAVSSSSRLRELRQALIRASRYKAPELQQLEAAAALIIAMAKLDTIDGVTHEEFVRAHMNAGERLLQGISKAQPSLAAALGLPHIVGDDQHAEGAEAAAGETVLQWLKIQPYKCLGHFQNVAHATHECDWLQHNTGAGIRYIAKYMSCSVFSIKNALRRYSTANRLPYSLVDDYTSLLKGSVGGVPVKGFGDSSSQHAAAAQGASYGNGGQQRSSRLGPREFTPPREHRWAAPPPPPPPPPTPGATAVAVAGGAVMPRGLSLQQSSMPTAGMQPVEPMSAAATPLGSLLQQPGMVSSALEALIFNALRRDQLQQAMQMQVQGQQQQQMPQQQQQMPPQQQQMTPDRHYRYGSRRYSKRGRY